jgi:hypothetical protein
MNKRKHPLPIAGDRFGRLTVSGEPFAAHRGWRVPCTCDCGTLVSPGFNDLRIRSTTSCDCYQKESVTRHGDRVSNVEMPRLYSIWRSMVARCENPDATSYPRYGGSGITVCSSWRSDYAAFRDWSLANDYQDGLTIDRIDNSLGYTPANSRWSSYKEQSRNQQRAVVLTAFGETKSLTAWAEDPRCMVTHDTLYKRTQGYRWEPESAITTPAQRK